MVDNDAGERGRLRLAREQLRLTQAEVAEQLAELAWCRDRRHVGVGPDMVSKWERGEKSPSRLYRELLCLLYAKPASVLGLASSPSAAAEVAGSRDHVDSADVPWAEIVLALGTASQLLHAQLIELWEYELMKRRELLKSMGLAAVASALAPLCPPVAGKPWQVDDLRPDRETLDGLDTLAGRYQQLYHGAAPRLLITPIQAHLRTVDQLLRHARSSIERRKLLANHSQVAQLAGRLAFFDLQDPLSARGYFTTAYDSAIAAGDSAMAAGALGHLAFVPAASGQWAAATDHLRHARMHAEAGAPLLMRSWLAAVTSEIRADAGDEAGALCAVDEAKRAIDGSSAAPRPSWFDFYDMTRLRGFEGYALLRTGHSSEAARQLGQALDALEPTAVKQRTVFLTDLATVHVRDGDIDRACALALEAASALAARPYATCVNRLREFRSTLRPFATSRAVGELDRAIVDL